MSMARGLRAPGSAGDSSPPSPRGRRRLRASLAVSGRRRAPSQPWLSIDQRDDSSKACSGSPARPHAPHHQYPPSAGAVAAAPQRRSGDSRCGKPPENEVKFGVLDLRWNDGRRDASLTGERPVLLLPRGKGVFLVECARGLEPALHMTLHQHTCPRPLSHWWGIPATRLHPSSGRHLRRATWPKFSTHQTRILGYDAAKWPYSAASTMDVRGRPCDRRSTYES